jgi:hypothetical protein
MISVSGLVSKPARPKQVGKFLAQVVSNGGLLIELLMPSCGARFLQVSDKIEI